MAATTLLTASAAVILPTTAFASTGDRLAPVTTTSGTTYSQTFNRADGDVTATYTLAGSRVVQNASATSAMNSRGSSVVFSPTGVSSSTGALINNNLPPTACAGGNGTATDCGTSGTVTIAFSRPVTNPTVHVAGLGGQQTYGTTQAPEYANFATYADLTASTSSTSAANSAAFAQLLGTPTNLQLSDGRLQTTGTRPGTSCDTNGTTGGTSTAGCGSVLVAGTNLTSITLTLGIRNSGSATDPSATANQLTDAFLLSTSVPDVPTPGTRFSCYSNSVYAVHDTDWNIQKVDVDTGAESFVGHVNAAAGTELDGLAITANGGAAYAVNRVVSPGGPTTVYRLDPVTGASTSYSGPALNATTSGSALVGGAIDPVNGVYYFGLVGGDGLELYGFDTNTNTRVTGRIAHIPGVATASADFVFDSRGRLLVLSSDGDGTAIANPFGATLSPMPSTGDDAVLSLGTSGYVKPSGETFLGLAVDLPQGYLYGTTTSGGQSVLRQVSPSSGTQIDSHAITYQGQPTGQVSDLASCASANTMQVQADVVSRKNPTDQFSVQVTGGGISVPQAGTTSGSSTGVQSDTAATAGPFAALAGASYTFAETAASGTDLSDYVTTWRCVTLNAPGTTLVSGTGTSGTVTFPTPVDAAGVPLACYFRNAPVAPSIAITKTTDRPAYHVGDTVTYTVEVTNTGNVALTGVEVTDPSNAPCARTIGSLAAGSSSTATCTATAPVPSDSNTASVSGQDSRGTVVTASSTAPVPVIRPALTLSRTASPTTVTAAGQTVVHTFSVTNSGDSTITGLSIDDTAVAPGGVANPISCDDTTLPANESTTCTGTYVATQDDIDHGSITDTAKVVGTDQLGSTVTSNASPQTVTATRTSGLSILASATPTVVATKNSTVSYSFQVTNTGNTTISNWSVTNTFDNPAVVAPSISCPGVDLTPNATKTCTATYTVTQDDLDEGSITATAHATGAAPTGSVDSNDSVTSVTASTAASLSMSRTATPATISAKGDTVTYSFAVTNNGGQTVHGLAIDATFTAPAAPALVVSCRTTDLAPGDDTTCSATYTATQDDVDHGSIADSAVARGTTRQGTASSGTVTTSVTIPSAPALTVTGGPAPTAVSAVGQHVTYSYTVQNSGNVTVHDVALANVLDAPATPQPAVSCTKTVLTPGATATCTAVYTVTQDDLDNRSIASTATATGLDPNAADVTSSDLEKSVQVTATKGLTVTATATPAAVDAVDQAVTATFVVRNDGNQTVTTVAVVAGAPNGDPLTVSCDVDTLAPGALATCTAIYSTTQDDLDNGSVSITGTATAVAPGDVAVGPKSSTATVPVTTLGGLRFAATSSPTSVTAAGQVVTFTFTVKNTGNRTADDISVAATAPDGTALDVTCTATSLAPDATTTCTATYTVTQDDIDAGSIAVSASLSGSAGATPISTSLATPVTVVVKHPSIAAALTGRLAVDDGASSVGDKVLWTVRVSNPGAIDLADLAVVDGAGRPGRCDTTDLTAGASTTCTLTSTSLTQRMLDEGTVTNTASVGATGSGQQVAATSTANVAVDADTVGGGDANGPSQGSAGPTPGDDTDNGALPSSNGGLLPLPTSAGLPADTGVAHLPLLVWSGLLLVLGGLVTGLAGRRRRA